MAAAFQRERPGPDFKSIPFVPGATSSPPGLLFRLSEPCDSLHSHVRSPEYFFSRLIWSQREPARTADLRPPACLLAEPQSSNPGPALRQTSRQEQGMIYSVAGLEIGELVKQKVLYGQPQSRNSLFNL